MVAQSALSAARRETWPCHPVWPFIFVCPHGRGSLGSGTRPLKHRGGCAPGVCAVCGTAPAAPWELLTRGRAQSSPSTCPMDHGRASLSPPALPYAGPDLSPGLTVRSAGVRWGNRSQPRGPLCRPTSTADLEKLSLEVP